jgi:hypothetical protein
MLTEDRIPKFYEYDPRDATARAYGYGWRDPDPADFERVYRPYGHYRFWDGFVTKIFNRPFPGENPYPTHRSMRASRAFEGSLRIIPLEFLDGVAISPPLTDEERRTLPKGGTIPVKLPLSGPPIIARRWMLALENARAVPLFEVAVSPFYV